MVTAMAEFMSGLEKCLEAHRNGSNGDAVFFAEQLRRSGQLLAVRPEFRERLSQRTKLPPQEVLDAFSHFLACASECRHNGVKQVNSRL